MPPWTMCWIRSSRKIVTEPGKYEVRFKNRGDIRGPLPSDQRLAGSAGIHSRVMRRDGRPPPITPYAGASFPPSYASNNKWNRPAVFTTAIPSLKGGGMVKHKGHTNPPLRSINPHFPPFFDSGVSPCKYSYSLILKGMTTLPMKSMNP